MKYHRMLLALVLILALAPLSGSTRAEEQSCTVSDTADFCRAFAALSDAACPAFSISMPMTVYRSFVEADNSGWAFFHGSCGAAGYDGTLEDQGSTAVVHFTNVRYYSGCRIWAAVRDGTVDSLPASDQQTLQAAKDAVSSIRGTEAERFLQIHDWLCSHTDYFTDDDPENWNDRAEGALLHGQADCDGYADALFLLCRLSGLDVRYVSGEAVGGRTEQDAGHMWNAVKLDGRWVMTDVTWDDQEDGISYLYYCTGADRLRLDHTWHEPLPDCSPCAADQYDLAPSGVPMTAVQDAGQADQVLADLAEVKPQRFLVLTGLDGEALESAMRRAGAASWSMLTAPGAVEFRDVAWHSAFHYCDSGEEAVRWINALDNETIPAELTLLFSPDCGPALFADEKTALERLIYTTRLAAPVLWGCSEEDYRLVIHDPVLLPDVLPIISSDESLEQYLDQALASQPGTLEFMLDGSFAAVFRSADLFDQLYRRGVSGSDGLYLLGGVRVQVTGILYYPEYRIVTTRQEALDYLQDCAGRGVSDCRLYCPEPLYHQWTADGGREFFQLLTDAGYSLSSFGFIDAYRLIILGED
ncbi:MAG: hypothetical protein IKH77_09935 [Clostridia bacterium]|nr:hypothetical protein [Clostridia bacterium]